MLVFTKGRKNRSLENKSLSLFCYPKKVGGIVKTNFEKEKNEIDIVKIDVKGHETSVINGFKLSLSNKRISPKVMMIELVDEHLARFGHNKGELINFINSFGYEPYINYRGKKLEEYLDGR